jgi:thioredoxin-related protein
MNLPRILSSVVLFAAVLGTPSSVLRAEEVQWRHDYNAARREAWETGRPLVVDFGTANCFWCRKLDATTFRDPTIVAVLNQRFIPLKVDASRDELLARALHVQAFPTLVLAAPDGKILGSYPGYLDVAPLHELLVRVLTTLTARPAAKTEARSRRAQELLTQAREEFRAQQYSRCLDRCESLTTGYSDLLEGAEAVQMVSEIKSNPAWLGQACDSLGNQLAGLYLELADTWLKRGQPQQAVPCLERVVRILPGSRYAEAAQARLARISAHLTPTADKRN